MPKTLRSLKNAIGWAPPLDVHFTHLLFFEAPIRTFGMDPNLQENVLDIEEKGRLHVSTRRDAERLDTLLQELPLSAKFCCCSVKRKSRRALLGTCFFRLRLAGGARCKGNSQKHSSNHSSSCSTIDSNSDSRQ